MAWLWTVKFVVAHDFSDWGIAHRLFDSARCVGDVLDIDYQNRN